jgi:CRISPR-associated protein Cas2
MAEGELAYVICYDIADDRRRTHLSKALDGYGRRVQYSVYEAVLNRQLFDKMVARIASIVDADADRVTIYGLCSACAGRRQFLGRASGDWPGREVVLVI